MIDVGLGVGGGVGVGDGVGVIVCSGFSGPGLSITIGSTIDAMSPSSTVAVNLSCST